MSKFIIYSILNNIQRIKVIKKNIKLRRFLTTNKIDSGIE